MPIRKIGIISPCLTMGGMERASSNIANALSCKGLEIHYLAILKQEKFFQLNKEISFYEPPDFNSNQLSIHKTVKWLRKTILLIQPEAVLVYGQFYSAITLLALSNTKIAVFISERSSPLLKWPLKQRLFNQVVFTFRRPKGILAQTSMAAEYQQKYYGSSVPIQVIPNAVKEVKLYPGAKRRKTILAVGRFNDHLKGFDRLIETFALLENDEWQLVFAGGDENGEVLKEQARQLGVLDRIIFLGKVKNLDKVYAEARIFVIPSRSEGFPNALCEAMAAGMPCISFDFIAGPRDIITPGVDGYLVADGNTKELAEKILFLIENPAVREKIGKAAMKIRERLELDQISAEHYKFLNTTSKI